MYPKEIGGVSYTREQLIEYGKKTYPKFYWIPRGIGLFLAVNSCILIPLVAITTSDINKLKKDYPDAYYARQIAQLETKNNLLVFMTVLIVIAAIVCLVVSFIKKRDEQYIAHAERRLWALYDKEHPISNIINDDAQLKADESISDSNEDPSEDIDI